MEEVADIERAGVFSQPEQTVNEEVAKGEKVVGCIADQPYLMALCMASENRAQAYKDKIFQTTTEDEILRVYKEFGPIIDMVWAEIRLHFGAFNGTVGLRKGWTVVRVKDEQPMPELNILDLLFPHGALCADGGYFDPKRPTLGINRIGRRKIGEA